MQLEKIEQKEELLNETQTRDLFHSIIMGKEVTEWIETTRGKFKVKFPRARDIQTIGKLTAMRLNGLSVQCFDYAVYNLIQQICTLDVIVLEGPDWYQLAKKENKNFGWQDIPSQTFIQEVYALAYKFRLEVQAELDGNSEQTDRELVDDRHSDASAESGLFEGLSGKS